MHSNVRLQLMRYSSHAECCLLSTEVKYQSGFSKLLKGLIEALKVQNDCKSVLKMQHTNELHCLFLFLLKLLS